MVSRTNRHALSVQNGADVVWMGSVHDKRQRGGLVARRTDDAEAVDFGDSRRRLLEKCSLVRLDVLKKVTPIPGLEAGGGS